MIKNYFLLFSFSICSVFAQNNSNKTNSIETETKEVRVMKKIGWLGLTTIIGLGCFLYGFFIAP